MADSDAELTARIIAGSDAAGYELVRRYQRPVFNLVARMVHDPALAEDLAQDSFLKAFTHLASYDPACKFSNWILKIAHNTAIDYLRRGQPATTVLDEQHPASALDTLRSSIPGPHVLAERRQLADAFDDAIDRLRPEYREIVVLRYQEDLSYEEIAEVLSLPIGTVKSYLHRARAELAETMKQAGWGGCNTDRPVSVGLREKS
jgi:RNA polymerase sigma-70 factor (ECF subfamily)